MVTRLVVILGVALAGCGKGDRTAGDQGKVIAPSVLADIELWPHPDGWTESYDAATDAWTVRSADGHTTVRIERADERYVASPDAFMHHVAATRWSKDKLVTIEDREVIGNGFELTLAVYAGANDSHPLRATYVVRKLKKIWYQCHADGVDDDALRTQIIAVCRSVHVTGS